ncbi:MULTISPECIES: hypothetical protein [Streptomyces]|uniref:hypothetical protein n=1 Tax=Streptomyces TaxID=1883 RepID=UPI002E28FD60|nr:MULTISPECIES: hypothetical protein [Streptomyces]
MSEMTCRDCDLGGYLVRPGGLVQCTECRRTTAISDLYQNPDTTWDVSDSMLLQQYLNPDACLAALDDIARWDTGDWAKAQEALGHYRRLVAELSASLHVGLRPALAPHRGPAHD